MWALNHPQTPDVFIVTTTQPLISVITPAFNSASYIGETIASVRAQTWQNWEMLVVDDGSSDETRAVVAESAQGDPRVRCIALGHNSGRPSVPRNHGIRQAHGSYLAFLDSDDLWLPQKLERQLRFMEQHPDIFMSYTRCTVQKNGRSVRVKPNRSIHGAIFAPLFLLNNFVPCLTVMMRRDNGAATAYLFDEDPRLRAIEDYDLWLTIAHEKRIGFIDEPLAIFRCREGSIFGSEGIGGYIRRSNLVAGKYKGRVPAQLLVAKYVLSYAQALALCIKGAVSKN